jgi:hypothetical protein
MPGKYHSAKDLEGGAMRQFVKLAMWLVAAVIISGNTFAEDALQQDFLAPPAKAKPAVWWFWGETVTTDHGITQDLEALKRVGFGGVVIYEQTFVDRSDALQSLSPEWLARVRFAAAECARLGMTLEVNTGDGYVAGGPWITPALGMQRLVASQVEIQGGKSVSLTLPMPPIKLGYYQDVAVLAFPTPSGGGSTAMPAPACSSIPAGIDLKQLFNSDDSTMQDLKPPADGSPVLIQLDYGQPATARSITYSTKCKFKALVIATQMPTSWADDYYGQGMKPILPLGELEASDDAQVWRPVCRLPGTGYQQDYWIQQTVAFPATTARYFRLKLDVTPDVLKLGGFALRGEARIDQWEKKSGNVVDFSYPDHTPDYSDAAIINPAKIIDISKDVDAAGKLTWTPPPGNWTVLRLGHTPTGARTKHGRPENLGLECDKLSAAATTVQYENYVGVIRREVQSVPGAKLAGINMDSAEHGSQNWTPDFEAQFAKRRGYSMHQYLPAMMGYIVGSRTESDKFLFDVRRTIADLMSDEYYGTFEKLAHEHGMTFMAQAPGIATCLPSDNIQAKGRTDIPMGEFWMSQPDGTMDCKEAASAAHVYGLPIAAAESFTGSRATTYPAVMKPFADAALALGINRFVVLADIHQPWDNRVPGVTEANNLVPYERHNTWWEYSGPFWNTLARSSEMMRQGYPVADLLYDLGDDTPLKVATWRMRPAPPVGYDYDVCGDEVIINRARVKDGRIELPGGANYRLLVLANGDKMTLSAARKIRALVDAGAVVLGEIKPDGSPSLSDGPSGDAEVCAIADELWGKGPLTASGSHRTGAGQMLWGITPAQALATVNTPPDFDLTGNESGLKLIFAHRHADDSDIYFVANHSPTPGKIMAAFRANGGAPERWDPATGAMAAIDNAHTADNRTEITLTLEPYASTFVVFHAPRAATAPLRPAENELVEAMPPLLDLTGSWNVQFTPGWGAPDQVTFPQLQSWTQEDNPGIRNYSGTAVYTQSFDCPAVPTGQRVVLDLGQVDVIASVRLNNKDLGIVWKAPYALDVTSSLLPGKNTLQIRVANLWVNRLIADAGLPEAERKTWVTSNPYRPTDPLLPSGLLGPVRLLHAQ